MSISSYTLEILARGGRARFDENLLAFASFAYDLNKARLLPNYDLAIRPRLKEDQFPKVQYEVYVAGLCVRFGHRVEFIVPSTERSADLKLLVVSGEIHVECTRKDPYQPGDVPDGGAWRELSKSILYVQGELGSSHEVVVFSFGTLRPESIPELVAAVRRALKDQLEGLWTNRKLDCALAVHKLPATSPEKGVFLMVPSWQNPSVAEGTVAEDERGRKYVKDPRRVALYRFDSHRLNGIIQSFDAKRRQIAESGLGLIYIDLDVSHVRGPDVSLYLEFVTMAVSAILTPAANTRVGAVSLSTGPVFTETERNGERTTTLHRTFRAVRNPYSSLPKEFVVPGENL